ncbi:MAG: hypothetical protein DMD80_12365 [Candidatus Rokuibacteriota bacterium]|nr:MAG: hypothetical protein DMD80_12365 [Candidatus Rokubacteria bacterium]
MPSTRGGRRLGGLVVALGLCASGCFDNSSSKVVRDRADLDRVLATQHRAVNEFLTAADVNEITRVAAVALDATTMVIAVTDREGQVLAVFRKAGAPVTAPGNFGALVDANDLAVSLARTGAFFSNDQAPLSSRTVRFISGIHFPPGISGKANAALYGIENTNRGCPLTSPEVPAFNPGQSVPQSRSLNGLPCDSLNQTGCGLGITTGKADVFDSDPGAVNGGGVPIFKNGQVVGGIGVTGVPGPLAEFAAFAGSAPSGAFGPRPADPGVIFLDGIALPFVAQATRPPGTSTGVFAGAFVVGPLASPRAAAGVADGWLIGPFASTELTQAEVTDIVSQAVAQALKTRAAIRLPMGISTRMVIAVSDLQGTTRGLFRMPDSTIFSIDVAVAKARNVVYFSSPTRVPSDLAGVPLRTAVTNRTISFGAQPLYPPGIDPPPGPFFPLYVGDVATPCQQGSQPPDQHQSGIVFFPGSVPLYRGGQLIGGLGISGDGVEQDDLVAAAGGTGFAPPLEIRADQIVIGGARLPFLKFPRNPEATASVSASLAGGAGAGVTAGLTNVRSSFPTTFAQDWASEIAAAAAAPDDTSGPAPPPMAVGVSTVFGTPAADVRTAEASPAEPSDNGRLVIKVQLDPSVLLVTNQPLDVPRLLRGERIRP